jgi:hypothetical protein
MIEDWRQRAAAMTQSDWIECLAATFSAVTASPDCRDILNELAGKQLQLAVTDRPEMSYWEVTAWFLLWA